MRETIGICVGIVLGIWPASSPAMPITGQVVDNKARPVQGAEVVVCEKCRVGIYDEEARTISPVVRTDAEGRFALDVGVASQRDAFVVARKPGLAYAWEWLNFTLGTFSRKHIPLVLEPACVLAGQVVDPEGRPVAGAEVQATPVNTRGFSDAVAKCAVPGPASWFTVTADAQGWFRFEQFAADGSADLRVRAPGTESRYVFHRHGSDFGGFEVGGADIQVALPREGMVRGRVVDSQGRPVSGVDVMIRSDRDRKGTLHPYVAHTTKSDATGAFVFAGVPEGLHWLGVPFFERGQGPRLWTSVESKVSVKAGEVAETTVRVSKGGVLEVVALDARTRHPIAGAQLHVGSAQGHSGEFATTDATGVARVHLPPETYGVHVSTGPLSACESSEKIGEGQTIRRTALLKSPPKVSGRVLDPQGRPMADVAVVVAFGDHTYTDAQGRFESGYDERFAPDLVTAQAARMGWAGAVRVSDPSKPVELRLGPAWTLTGRVADSNGVGIPAARLSLSHVDAGVLTDPQGRFEIRAIPPVQKGLDYRLSATAAGYGQAFDLKTFLRGAPGAAVDLGTIRLAVANVSVSGVVVDAKGAPVAQIPVFVSGRWPVENQPHRMGVTNERGEFTVTRVCAGPANLGANFANSPRGCGSLKTYLPARNVKIVIGKDLTDTSNTPVRNTASPQLTDLCPSLACLQTDGRPLLLCFIDIAQQPSQQFLMDLAKRTDVLDAQGVIAVVVRTATVDIRPYNAFAKANHLTFCHLFLAKDDFEARKAAWGIKSVPWLILTNRQHAVCASGFPLSELDHQVETVIEGRQRLCKRDSSAPAVPDGSAARGSGEGSFSRRLPCERPLGFACGSSWESGLRAVRP